MNLQSVIRYLCRSHKKRLSKVSLDLGKTPQFLANSLNKNASMRTDTLMDILQAIGGCELVIRDRVTGEEFVIEKPKKIDDLIGGERVADKPTKADDLIG